MRVTINIRPEELTDDFVQKLRDYTATARNIEIRIDGDDLRNHLSEADVASRLRNLSEGKSVSFTFDELKAHAQKIAG